MVRLYRYAKSKIRERLAGLTRPLVLAVVSALATAIALAITAAWIITIGWLKLVVLIVLVQL